MHGVGVFGKIVVQLIPLVRSRRDRETSREDMINSYNLQCVVVWPDEYLMLNETYAFFGVW